MLNKTRAEESWRSVLKLLQNLEYEINIFQIKSWNRSLVISTEGTCTIESYFYFHEKGLKRLKAIYYFQLKEFIPPHNIPSPTPAPAHPLGDTSNIVSNVSNNISRFWGCHTVQFRRPFLTLQNYIFEYHIMELGYPHPCTWISPSWTWISPSLDLDIRFPSFLCY